MSLIKCDKLMIGYDKTMVSSVLNFEINEGDYLCILGENGAGKSTLMKTLLGLIKPISGNLIFEEGLNSQKIGYLPQQTLVQKDFPASVEEIVISGTLGNGGFNFFYSHQQKELAARHMRELGIYDIRKSAYCNLSGGQQQRVLLARALCATDKLLILDEPVNGLDPNASSELYELIKSLNRNGVTIIMVSHDINVATKYASHILHMGKTKSFYVPKEKYLMSNAWSIGRRGGNKDE
ncbi:MAG: ATP-binding cassette domain-containing protein [Lachnospiraceae bacterium]|nr:ATP-binding cassette domain-containing protein [Lachnospiraceae bacterium]